MKMKKILLLLLLPFVTEFLAGCCGRCDTPLPGTYTNNLLTVAAIDNSGEHWKLSGTSPVIKTAYGIQLQISRKQIVRNALKPGALFSRSAYALSCRPCDKADLSPKDTIVDIQVISFNDFDDTHLANADISAYFKVLEQSTYASIPDHLAQMPLHIDNIFDMGISANLMLVTPPARSGEYGFFVKLLLSDGRMLSATIYNTLL